MRSAGPRLNCAVPGCKRTRGQRKGENPIRESDEWICGPHWQAVPAYIRRRKTKLFQRYRRGFGDNAFWKYPPGSEQRLAALRLDKLCGQAWTLAKRAAIERGVGLR